jgi:putative addiction module component (TIGR02574 family)
MIQAADIERMSLEERLQAMELIWVSLSRTPDQVPSPDWHREVLGARLAKVERGEGKFLSIPQLKERLQKPNL